MKTIRSLCSLALLLIAGQLHGEFLQMDLSIFGMD
jgi:hypothetical protein